MSILNVGLGFILLLAGRPIYAVFTGVIGFLIGVSISGVLVRAPNGWNQAALPLLFAALGALAAFTFRRWAARVAGFVAGGYLIYNLPVVLGASYTLGGWPLFLIAGIVCIILLMIWFDYSLMIISTLTGVTLILQSMKFGTLDVGTMFIILTLFGLVVQFLLYQYGRPSPD